MFEDHIKGVDILGVTYNNFHYLNLDFSNRIMLEVMDVERGFEDEGIEPFVVLQDLMQWFFLNCSVISDRILSAKDNSVFYITELIKKSFNFNEPDNTKIKLEEEQFF